MQMITCELGLSCLKILLPLLLLKERGGLHMEFEGLNHERGKTATKGSVCTFCNLMSISLTHNANFDINST